MLQVIAAPPISGELFDSAPWLDDPATLRKHLAERGYLFVRGLLPVEDLLQVRHEIIELLDKNGWINRSFSLMEAYAAPGVGPYVESVNPEYSHVYDQILRLESFHSLPHTPAMVKLFRDLFDEEPLLHPRHIARVVFPNSEEETTPPHQDYVHIRGSKNTLTAWFPTGDCPRELGGLTILEGSHKKGLRPTVPARGAGHKGILVDDSNQRWVGADYKAGDAVVFLSMAVHAGTPNLTGNRLRLSMDIRSSPLSQPVHPSSLLPHMNRVTWDQLYAGWKSTRYQRYWEKMNLHISEEDLSSGGY